MTEEVKPEQAQGETVPAQADAKKSAGRAASIKFDHNVEIFPDTRMPEYDSGDVKAYRAISRDKVNYFALVCERHLVPRTRSATNYAGLLNPFLVPLVAMGKIFWSPAGQERFVIIYKDVLGKRLMKETDYALDWRQDDVMNIVVKPMIGALVDFRNRDFAHGAIRPSNMFYTGPASKPEKIVLGDCLALPSSYNQPVLYQTIERGMVAPIARGEATLTDDLYAFGVSLAVLMRSNDPLEGMTDDEIVRAKIELGSYAAITGKERFKGSILELLRGVLHDDPTQRWTLEEVMVWLDGRRLSPKQSIKEKKAPRPVLFSGEKYFLSSLLAMSLDSNPGDAVRLVESDDLNQWLIRSVEDDVALERVENAIKTTREKGTGPGYEDRLVANLSIALDTKAPLRFRGLRMTGDGVGKAMAEAMVLRHEIQPFVDLFAQNIAFNWITVQENQHIDVGNLISRFDSCRNFIRHGKIGYGIERCVYLLCPEAHCLSDKFNDYHVLTPEDMVLAFEDLCKKGKAPINFLDRHCAAFLSVKDSKVIDTYLFDLASWEDYKKILGNLKCLATIQERSSMPMLPGLASAFMETIDVICERYHDRDVREKLQKSVARYAAEGDLAKMAGILNNAELMARDLGGFKEAMREYNGLQKEYVELETRLADAANFGKSAGREVAAVTSSIIAAIIILAASFMFFAHTSTY
ncbi:MAG: hypothetical protein KA155_03690 [Alphaproteobacteria bacterium]|jgi:hypothetical protein|nr:hypothetical protein [Alphaproteobacteria bacterium]